MIKLNKTKSIVKSNVEVKDVNLEIKERIESSVQQIIDNFSNEFNREVEIEFTVTVK